MLQWRHMMRALRGVVLASMLAGLAIGGPASADEATQFPPAPMHEQVLSLPGDPERPVTLQVTLFTPQGAGPFPLAVMNHGAAANGNAASEPRYRATFSAYYFLSRGYAVALPMMRGFAGSGGQVGRHGCDVAALGINNARDIAAVINVLATTQPNIDFSRIVVAGQSFGGWNTLAFGLVGHAGVKGLVNFEGGVRESDCTNQDASLVATAAYFGAHTTLPSLWFYGDNDKTFPPETWRAMYARYTSSHGPAELVAYGSFMDDAHQLLSHGESIPIWVPRLDAFLQRIGLPGRVVDPAYMPIPVPPPTHYAAIDDVNAVPYLSDAGRNTYRGFLQRPFTRAFALAPNGISVATNGGFDALARALTLCGQHAAGCQLYAVDNDVVWHKPNAADLPVYRKTVAAGTTTTLNFAYGVNPDCSSRGLPKIRVVQAPEHGTATVASREDFPRFPANHPDAACNQRRVAGTAVDYTPAAGFTGADSLAFEEISLDHRDTVFRIAITVR
jgi:dienelactone hydrolase